MRTKAAPHKLVPGTPVIIRLGPKHRQWERIHDNAKFKWIEGVIDWVAPSNPRMFEIRISRRNCVVTKSTLFEQRDFYVRVEYEDFDGFNFRDVTVIRRVAE
jgi:hypothetical protein